MLQLTAIGRLTRDPEFKSNRQGSQFLVFDLAVNNVVVTGELSTEIYQKNDGSTGENIKCFVTSFSFISSGSGQRNNQQNGNQNGNYAPQQNSNQYVQQPMNNGQQYQQQPPMNNGQQYAQQPPMNNGQTYQQSHQPPANQGYAPANQYANPNNYGSNYPANYEEQNVTGDLPF